MFHCSFQLSPICLHFLSTLLLFSSASVFPLPTLSARSCLALSLYLSPSLFPPWEYVCKCSQRRCDITPGFPLVRYLAVSFPFAIFYCSAVIPPSIIHVMCCIPFTLFFHLHLGVHFSTVCLYFSPCAHPLPHFLRSFLIIPLSFTSLSPCLWHADAHKDMLSMDK